MRLTISDDPPFFLQQSSSEETPFDEQAHPANESAQLPSGYAPRVGDDDTTDEYRGVIDDLTIENKKLKRRLKKYEKLHDAHLKDDKLFEVRVHGLPAAHKRELEDMLQKFALGLNNTPDLAAHSSRKPALTTQATNTSSYASQFHDSAYASASASGQDSSAQSALDNTRKNLFKQSSKSREQNIETYLHDIPRSLQPRHPTVMTEKAKKQLVVRRLEQIFAGKGADKGGHHHPLQQQEVSKLAAKADRSAIGPLERTPLAEGTREATIMDGDGDAMGNGAYTPSPDSDSTQHMAPGQKVIERDFAEDSSEQQSLEQRPTRPLDLDTERAQIPADNFSYLRHLGFSPPDLDTMAAFTGGHGWVYLNLLINMAQLHTINVTTDFVQKALSEHSNRFELSHDGRRVRWRGGKNLTRTISEGDDTSPEGAGGSTSGQIPRKRMKTSHERLLHQHRLEDPQNRKLAYTPLFFHGNSEDTSEESSLLLEGSTRCHRHAAASTSSGAGNSTARPGLKKRHRSGDGGPIIFYNNASFCADLSGDHRTSGNMEQPIFYFTPTSHPLGATIKPDSGRVLEKRGPLDEAGDLPEPMDLCDNPIPEIMEVGFPPQTPLTSASEQSPVTFEASGIGGVYPSDNFALNVKTQHGRAAKAEIPAEQTQCSGRVYAPRISQVLVDKITSQTAQPQAHKVLSTRRRDMPPSELPPAACVMDDDESEYDSDAESSSYIERDMASILPPAAAPRMINFPSWSDESEVGDDEDDDMDSDSDGSFDLLATARQADPEGVRAREREFDAATAERLAEEIPAGNSAATAAGGSGFTTPESGFDAAEFEAATKLRNKTQGKAPPMLRRISTSDSMVVNGDSP